MNMDTGNHLVRSNSLSIRYEIDRWAGHDRLIDLRYWGKVKPPKTVDHALELLLAAHPQLSSPQVLEAAIERVQKANKNNALDSLDVCKHYRNGFRFKFKSTRSAVRRRAFEAGLETESRLSEESDEGPSTMKDFQHIAYPFKPQDSDSSTAESFERDHEDRPIQFEVDTWKVTDLINLENWGCVKAPKTRKQAIELVLKTFSTRRPPTEEVRDKIKEIETGGRNYVGMTQDYLLQVHPFGEVWFAPKYAETLHLAALAKGHLEIAAHPYPSSDKQHGSRRLERPGEILSRNFGIDGWKWEIGTSPPIVDPYEFIEITMATMEEDAEFSSYEIYYQLRMVDNAIINKSDMNTNLRKIYGTNITVHIWVQKSLRARFGETRRVRDEWWLEALRTNEGLRKRAPPELQTSGDIETPSTNPFMGNPKGKRAKKPEEDSTTSAGASKVVAELARQALTNANQPNPTFQTINQLEELSEENQEVSPKASNKSNKSKKDKQEEISLSSAYKTRESLRTSRSEEHWEDGPYAQRGSEGAFLPPMRHPCIKFGDMTVDNLPPFFIKLTDEQAGHVTEFYSKQKRAKSFLNICWPADFESNGESRKRRLHAGPAYRGPRNSSTETFKEGGPPVKTVCPGPKWDELGGRHYYSSGRPMTRTEVVTTQTVTKSVTTRAVITPITTQAVITPITPVATIDNSALEGSTQAHKRRKLLDGSPLTAALRRQQSQTANTELQQRDLIIARLQNELDLAEARTQETEARLTQLTSLAHQLAHATQGMAAVKVWKRKLDEVLDQHMDGYVANLDLGKSTVEEAASSDVMTEIANVLQTMVIAVKDQLETDAEQNDNEAN